MGKGYRRKRLKTGYDMGVQHGMNYQWGKPWYKSRTLWMSVFLAVLTVIESRFNLLFSASESSVVLIVGTSISSLVAALRVITTGPVTVRQWEHE